jgi:hypothetical protein
MKLPATVPCGTITIPLSEWFPVKNLLRLIQNMFMDQNVHKKTSSGPLAAAVYYLLNILLFPIALIGYVVMSVSFYAGRKSAVSGTALAPLTGRWLLHNLGSRQDEPAKCLMMAMSGLSVSLALVPMVFAASILRAQPYRAAHDGAGDGWEARMGRFRHIRREVKKKGGSPIFGEPVDIN